MRPLKKAEAGREQEVSLPTLDRRIEASELQTLGETHGRRHRLYVVLGDSTTVDHADANRSRTALRWPRSAPGASKNRSPSCESSSNWSCGGARSCWRTCD